MSTRAERDAGRTKIKALHEELLAKRLSEGYDTNEAIKIASADLQEAVSDPRYTLTREQAEQFEEVYKKHMAAMGEAERALLELDRVEWDQQEQVFRVYCASGQWWHYTLDGTWY